MVGERILFVDAETIVRDLASELLTLTGYDVTTASSGEEALQACQLRLPIKGWRFSP